MEPGKLRHSVSLERLEAVTDTAGDVIQNEDGSIDNVWTSFATVWASIEPISVNEFIRSAMTQSQVTTRIAMWYRNDIDAGCRIVHNGKIYNVQGVLPDKESGLEYITLPCSEGVNDGT